MALDLLETNIVLDVYDHDGTRPSIKSIALDDNTRYVFARLTYQGVTYDIGSDATVELVIIRPDKVGAQIVGESKAIQMGQEDESIVTVYGAYAELDQPAIAVAGTLLGQFIITSGDQILRSQIFAVNNGEALDSDTWAGQYDGYNLDELVEMVDEAVDKVDDMEEDVAELKSGFNELYNTAYVTDSASGGVAHFEDGADNVPLKSLEVNIEPVQSGSGDPSPSNVRPITGFDAVKVTRTGKNLVGPFVDGSSESRGISITYADNLITFIGTSTGTNASSPNKYFYHNGERSPLLLRAGITYTASLHGRVSFTNNLRLIFTYESSTRLYYDSDDGVWTFTPDADVLITQAALRLPTTGSTADISAYFQLEIGSEATEYEPYNGNTYTISLSSAGTVYGGTIDVVSGMLTVDKAIVDLGTLNWTYESTIPRFYTNGLANVIRLIASNEDVVDGVSGMYKAVSFNNLYVTGKQNGTMAEATTKVVSVINTDYTDATTFKTAMSGQMFVYPLATPQTIQLSATEIKSLLGINNVWSDAGDVEVEYRADTKLYIDKRLAEVTA